MITYLFFALLASIVVYCQMCGYDRINGRAGFYPGIPEQYITWTCLTIGLMGPWAILYCAMADFWGYMATQFQSLLSPLDHNPTAVLYMAWVLTLIMAAFVAYAPGAAAIRFRALSQSCSCSVRHQGSGAAT